MFITCKLDNCNALLFGSPDKLKEKLQLIQNCAAKLIFNQSKYHHVMPFMEQLHWLPVKYHIVCTRSWSLPTRLLMDCHQFMPLIYWMHEDSLHHIVYSLLTNKYAKYQEPTQLPMETAQLALLHLNCGILSLLTLDHVTIWICYNLVQADNSSFCVAYLRFLIINLLSYVFEVWLQVHTYPSIH